MKRFKLEEREFDIPTKWEEVTLKVYVKLATLEETKEAFGIPELYVLKMLEALCDVDGGELDELTLDMVNELVLDIAFVQEQATWVNTKHIEIEGVDYVFPDDLNKLTMGEMVSIKTLQENHNGSGFIPYLLSIILRPGKKVYNEETKKETWKQEKFSIDNLEYRKELFLKQPVFNMMGPVSFFLGGNETFMNNIKDSIPAA